MYCLLVAMQWLVVQGTVQYATRQQGNTVQYSTVPCTSTFISKGTVHSSTVD